MDGNGTSILALIVLVAMSAFFSASETAYTSLNRVRLKNMAQGGSRRAAKALALAEDYDRLLSGILVGNNIVNILSASLATVLFVRLIGGAGVSVHKGEGNDCGRHDAAQPGLYDLNAEILVQ